LNSTPLTDKVAQDAVAGERDWSVYQSRIPFVVSPEVKRELPLWRTLKCKGCGAWDSWQVEVSSDFDWLRLTCLDCEMQAWLVLDMEHRPKFSRPKVDPNAKWD